MSKCDINLIYYRSLPSTNTELRRLAAAGAPEGTAVVAAVQTAGRGRMGRKFVSPAGGLYMSLLLRPETADVLRITSAAAVAAARTVKEEFGIDCGIKWVNDLYLDGKKVCGILTEAAYSSPGGPDYAAVGIGLNLSDPEGGFPEELRDIAGSIGVKCDRDTLIETAERIALTLVDTYRDPSLFIDEYRARSTVIGKDIYVISDGIAVKARATGVDDGCGLIVETEKGTEILRSGEISIRPR
ncbi:MAG: biotin--[acetyl-CoA-carboxylase] ligase [Eubacteriales bacterium]